MKRRLVLLGGVFLGLLCTGGVAHGQQMFNRNGFRVPPGQFNNFNPGLQPFNPGLQPFHPAFPQFPAALQGGLPNPGLSGWADRPPVFAHPYFYANFAAPFNNPYWLYSPIVSQYSWYGGMPWWAGPAVWDPAAAYLPFPGPNGAWLPNPFIPPNQLNNPNWPNFPNQNPALGQPAPPGVNQPGGINKLLP